MTTTTLIDDLLSHPLYKKIMLNLKKYRDLPEDTLREKRESSKRDFVYNLIKFSGFTLDPMQLQSILEQRGSTLSIRETLMVLNINSAFEYVDYLVNSPARFSENQLFYLHFILGQSMLPPNVRGQYKNTVTRDESGYHYNSNIKLSRDTQQLLDDLRYVSNPLTASCLSVCKLMQASPFNEFNEVIALLLEYYILAKAGLPIILHNETIQEFANLTTNYKYSELFLKDYSETLNRRS